jgi:hypothetical protein
MGAPPLSTGASCLARWSFLFCLHLHHHPTRVSQISLIVAYQLLHSFSHFLINFLRPSRLHCFQPLVELLPSMHPIFCSPVQVREVTISLDACLFEKALIELSVSDTLSAQRHMDSCLVLNCVTVRSIFWEELIKQFVETFDRVCVPSMEQLY